MSDNSEILEFIPQGPPFVMVSQIIKGGQESVITSFTISEDNILCEDGYFQESGLIENMAQSAAAMEGYNAKLRNEAVRIGFIGAIKKLRILQLPKVGDTLTTTIQVENQVLGVNIVKGEVHRNNDLIAECTLNIFLQE